jgi:ribonuclease D
LSPHITIIREPEAFRGWLSRHMGDGPLALDTEADGMFRYRARLCYMQLAAGDHVAIVDTLEVPAVHAAEALRATGPLKLLHDLAFDARLLAEHEVALTPVFDTAIAARYLGMRATGLKALLESELAVSLDKSMQQADWGKRPLSDDAIAYLAEDVRHLRSLSAALRARLRACDIEAETEEECAYALREAHQPRPAVSAFGRLPGLAAMAPKERARLHALVMMREQLAEARDVPAGRLIHTPILVAAAGLGRLPNSAFAQLHAEAEQNALRRALAEGDAASDAPESELARIFPSAPQPAQLRLQKRRKSRLVAYRERAAAERGVDPQVVLPGHCVQDLLGEPALSLDVLAALPGFGERRLMRVGPALVGALAPVWHEP